MKQTNRDKLINKIDLDTVLAMEGMKELELKQVIFEANNAMKTVRDELEANQEYQALLESKKAMESGKREVDSRQKAKIAFALDLIQSFGQSVKE